MKDDRRKMTGWGFFIALALLSLFLGAAAAAQVERAQVGIDGLT